MFSQTLARFRAMRPPVRSLVFLCWINSFTSGLTGIFIQIFLYQRFNNLSLNILATMSLYTGLMVGFCVTGWLASRLTLNIKMGFLWSFVIMGVATPAFLYTHSIASALWVSLLCGIGQGVYYLTVNTFELSETYKSERDFYSSVLSAGNQILSLLGPACATSLLWLSGVVLHIGTFTLLFVVAPAVYLLGFLCFKNIRDYYPKPITQADLAHFFVDRRNQYAQIYTAGTGFQQTLGVIVPPLVIFFILGSALHVGIYNTFFAVFSAFCVLVVAQYRTPSNRLRIYALTTVGLVCVISLFGYLFSFVALVIFTIIEGILSPLNNISSHVIDLDSMEIGRKESDFYATMLLRDFSLWVWRMVGGGVFLYVINFFHTQKEYLSVGLYLLATGLACTYLGAYFLVKKMQTESTNLLQSS